jgi:hypothetical protein
MQIRRRLTAALLFAATLLGAGAAVHGATWTGAIDGRLQIRMELDASGQRLTGSYVYVKYDKPIRLEGSVDPAGALVLTEYGENGSPTGVFRGRKLGEDRIEGTWSRPDGTRQLPFAVERIRERGAADVWSGTWELASANQFHGATLTIENEAADSFLFTLEATSGANVGEISGKARIERAGATFEDAENGCTLSFRRQGAQLDLEQTDGCSYYAGMGVFFAGRFERGAAPKVASLVDLGVLESAEQEAAFSKLVGEDLESYVNSFQMVYENEDLDGFGARVVWGGVRGLFTVMEALVMVAPEGRIWAAVLVSQGDAVRYHTNVPEWSGRLPRTIEAWRERFADRPVVHASRR